MEQLQAADIALDRFYRCRKSEGGAHAGFQRFLRDLIADERREDLRAAADEVLLQHLVDFRQVEFRQIVREEEPLIFAQPLCDGLREADLLIVIF